MTGDDWQWRGGACAGGRTHRVRGWMPRPLPLVGPKRPQEGACGPCRESKNRNLAKASLFASPQLLQAETVLNLSQLGAQNAAALHTRRKAARLCRARLAAGSSSGPGAWSGEEAAAWMGCGVQGCTRRQGSLLITTEFFSVLQDTFSQHGHEHALPLPILTRRWLAASSFFLLVFTVRLTATELATWILGCFAATQCWGKTTLPCLAVEHAWESLLAGIPIGSSHIAGRRHSTCIPVQCLAGEGNRGRTWERATGRRCLHHARPPTCARLKQLSCKLMCTDTSVAVAATCIVK